MTIHEINSGDLLIVLDRELKSWKRTRWWTKDLKNSEVHQRMFHLFKEFIAFRRKILSGADIEKSLCEWIGIDTFDPHSSIYRSKVNVPQMKFALEYERVINREAQS